MNKILKFSIIFLGFYATADIFDDIALYVKNEDGWNTLKIKNNVIDLKLDEITKQIEELQKKADLISSIDFDPDNITTKGPGYKKSPKLLALEMIAKLGYKTLKGQLNPELIIIKLKDEKAALNELSQRFANMEARERNWAANPALVEQLKKIVKDTSEKFFQISQINEKRAANPSKQLDKDLRKLKLSLFKNTQGLFDMTQKNLERLIKVTENNPQSIEKSQVKDKQQLTLLDANLNPNKVAQAQQQLEKIVEQARSGEGLQPVK